jgi:adenylosuccinate synthase
MREIVLISGRLCTGKTGLAVALEAEFNYSQIKSSDLVVAEAAKRGLPNDRKSLQKLGDDLDRETNGKWLYDLVLAEAAKLGGDGKVVVDNVRTRAQLEHFRNYHDCKVAHVHLYAPMEELRRRFVKEHGGDPSSIAERFSDADLLKDGDDVDGFKRDADVRINVERTDTRDNLVRVAARLGLYSPPDVRCVDVVVGGQFGSEGKGHIAAYLARDYDVLVRVGGPNAGHTVSSGSGVYTYHHLPSGTKDSQARVLLGPGMTIDLDGLRKEIGDCALGKERLFIDPQAMIIDDADKQSEKDLVASIASTGRGGGAAAARRIMKRSGGVRLARDIDWLRPYVGEAPAYRGSTVTQLEIAYREGRSVLVEGTQGSGLSIYHGQYPYVTSRDTNVAGCLAEAGISPSRVRRILMVVRTTPIRVANPDVTQPENESTAPAATAVVSAISGEIRHETSFEEIAKHAGIDPRELAENEKTSTTRRKRRVGWFDWEQYRLACALNAPTDIVLTFADYFGVDNRDARRFEQLNQDTIKFVEELERVAHAPVSLINTRFPRTEDERLDLRSVIDRRNWVTRKVRV